VRAVRAPRRGPRQDRGCSPADARTSGRSSPRDAARRSPAREGRRRSISRTAHRDAAAPATASCPDCPRRPARSRQLKIALAQRRGSTTASAGRRVGARHAAGPDAARGRPGPRARRLRHERRGAVLVVGENGHTFVVDASALRVEVEPGPPATAGRKTTSGGRCSGSAPCRAPISW
jgi:hypothetical protein